MASTIHCDGNGCGRFEVKRRPCAGGRMYSLPNLLVEEGEEGEEEEEEEEQQVRLSG